MPLIALAICAYASGLAAGLHGALVVGACLICVLLLLSIVKQTPYLAALAVLMGSGILFGRAAERSDHACACAALARQHFTARLLADAAPGEFVGAEVVGGACHLTAHLAVARGHAPSGALVSFDGSAALGNRGLVVSNTTVSPVAAPPFLDMLRSRAARGIDSAFGGDAPLARALLIADTRDLSPEVRDRYAAAGLVHMLSISGLHVGIIAMAVLLAFRACRLPVRMALVATTGITAFYVAMIGAPAPAVRAAVMLAAGAASRLFQRPTSPWASLAIGAGAPLLDPRTVLDLGYQLSVAGMVSLIASGALERRWLRPRVHGVARAVVGSVLASTVACVVTAPLVAGTFGRASLIAPLSNVLAAPVMACAQPVLFLAMLAGPWPSAARFLAGAAHPALAAFDWIARTSGSIPGATIDVAASNAVLLVAGVASICIVAACVRDDPWPSAIAALGCLALVAWLPYVPAPAGRVELHMIDVGQGDALALRTPHNQWVVFDAGRVWRGGDAGRSTVVPYLRARGGTTVAFVLSHPHADHVGGAASVLHALHPRLYIDAGFAGGGDAYRASLEEARNDGITWRRAHPGDSLDVDGVLLRFLAPDSTWTASLDDANLASTVVLIRYRRVRFLLVGDAEAPEEEWLLAHGDTLLHADVLKVGHHGSRTSSTPDFLAAVRPRIALISVGAGNGYGHPNAEVMGALAGVGAEVLRTDRFGTVVVRTDGVALSVQAGSRSWDLPPP
jgi:competence protein ComEC